MERKRLKQEDQAGWDRKEAGNKGENTWSNSKSKSPTYLRGSMPREALAIGYSACPYPEQRQSKCPCFLRKLKKCYEIIWPNNSLYQLQRL